MEHEQNTNRLLEIAYRLANDQDIKRATINDLTAEERTALDAVLESGSMETLFSDQESSPTKGMWWLA